MSETKNNPIETIVEVNSDEIFLNENLFTVDTIDEVDDIIQNHEEAIDTKYIVFRHIKDFGTTLKPPKITSNVFWNSRKGACVYIPFKGTPYLCLGQKIMECHMGRDKDRASKEKYNLNKIELLAKKQYYKVPRNRPTKKVGCTAKIYVQHLLRFPTIVIENNSNSAKQEGVKQLMGNYKEHRKTAFMEFIILLPNADQHLCKHNEQAIEVAKKSKEQVVMKQKREDIDNQVIDLVIRSALRGYGIKEIEAKVELFVKDDIFKGSSPPPMHMRKYYPKKKDYNTIMHEVKLKLACMRANKMKQDLLEKENPQEINSTDPLFSMLSYPTYKDKMSEDEVVQDVKRTWLISSKPKFRLPNAMIMQPHGNKTIELVMDMEEHKVEELNMKIAQKRSHASPTDRNGLLSEVTKKIQRLSDMTETILDDRELSNIDKQLNQLVSQPTNSPVSVVVRRKPNPALFNTQNLEKDHNN